MNVDDRGPDLIEAVGADFNLKKYLEAREFSIKAVHEIASMIQVGMNENDGHALIKDYFHKNNITRLWHPSKFRIGANTTKNFSEISNPDVVLQSDDLFFIDIGPVYRDYEGDFGATFLTNPSGVYRNIKDASERVFSECHEAWKLKGLSGKSLYDFACKSTEDKGFKLNLRMDGHRLSEFPHALYFKGGLADIDFTPKSGIWVLEIHLLEKENSYGAFFEDIIK